MQSLKSLLMTTLLLTASAFSAPALAGGGVSITFGSGHYSHHTGRHFHHRRTYSSDAYHRNRRGSSAGRRHHQVHRKNYAPRTGFFAGHQQYHHGASQGCHPVHKWVTDHYGKQTQIGGTKCYDAYGNGHVVPGSRYVIESGY